MQEARFARGDLEATDTGLALHFVKPGCRQAFAHRHDKAEEIYVVIRGAGKIKLDDEFGRDRPHGRDPRRAQGRPRL